MEVGQYKIDGRLLAYWVVGISAISLLAFSFTYVDWNLDSFTRSEDSGLQINFEDQTLKPGEVSKLNVTRQGKPVEGAEVKLEGLYIGDTNSLGIISFEALDEDFKVNATLEDEYVVEEVAVEKSGENPKEDSGDTGGNDSGEDKSDSDDDSQEPGDNTSDDSDQDEEAFTGFKLDEEPYAEETNYLTVYEEDTPLSRETVSLNGDNIGKTTPGGGLTFEVPNVRQITLEASGIEETFDVQGYVQKDDNDTVSGDIDPVFERTGMEYEGETVTFDASKTESKNPIESFNWTFEHADFTDTLEGEIVEYTIPEEGAYDITLKVTDSAGFTSTDEDYMKADPQYSGPEIILTSPSDGDTVTAEEEFEFQVDNARNGQEAHVVIGGRREATTPLESGLNIKEAEDSVLTPISETGQQDYWIEVEDSSNTWQSEKRTIENTRAYGDFGSFSIERPEDGAEVSSPVTFEFSLNIETDVNLKISGTGINEEERFSNQTLISSDQTSYTFNQYLNSTEYNWQASINVPSTSESESSSERTLTVQ